MKAPYTHNKAVFFSSVPLTSASVLGPARHPKRVEENPFFFLYILMDVHAGPVVWEARTETELGMEMVIGEEIF